MKYILVFSVDGYPDDGGGLYSDIFEDIGSLDKRVEEIMIEGHTLIAAGQYIEYKYKVTEVVKKVVRE